MADSRPRAAHRAGWRPILFALLLAAFVVRVGAQLIQALAPTPELPAFERWQSGALPYPLLLASQAIIIAAGVWATWAMWSGRPEPEPRLGRVMVWIGWVYLVGAAFRFFAGLTFLSHIAFFDVQLPGFFHIVLASMILIFAAHLADEARGRASRGDSNTPMGRGETTRKQA
jgi:hypothetical protein